MSRFPVIGRLAALALVVIAGRAVPAQAQQQPAQGQPTPRADGRLPQHPQLTLRNDTRDSVRVELRVGSAADCAQNGPAITRVIPPGRSWIIASPRSICWR
jgi:hypothetical protein